MNERGLLDLALARIPQLKGVDRVGLARNLRSEGDLTGLSRLDLERLVGHALGGGPWNPQALLEAARLDQAAAARLGIALVSIADSRYPPLLREMADPPLVLYYRGVLPDPERPLAAVVGTRKPSGAGSALAYRFGREFGAAGIPVVSGLALGIDAMAHRGNVEADAPSVAVLGSGLDGVYPASNRGLARRILQAGGALVSEYPPGTPPQKWHFPARNRIIAGLARATLVVEAPENSGALITAQFALDMGRDLWVSAVGLVSPAGAGSRALAEQGARTAGNAADITADWLYPAVAATAREFELLQE